MKKFFGTLICTEAFLTTYKAIKTDDKQEKKELAVKAVAYAALGLVILKWK